MPKVNELEIGNVVYDIEDKSVTGIVVAVEAANWVAQDDGTYTNIVSVEGVSSTTKYDVSLHGEISEEQAEAFDFLITSVDIQDGSVVFTASEQITVALSVLFRGRTDISSQNINVTDLRAANVPYDNSTSRLAATDVQNALDELENSTACTVVTISADGWDLQEDGTYKKIVAVDNLFVSDYVNVCLYPNDDYTDEQIIAYTELITSIDVQTGMVILTATEALTVSFRIMIYGKFNLSKDNIVVLNNVTAKDVSYNDAETNLGAVDTQGAIEKISTSVNNLATCIMSDQYKYSDDESYAIGAYCMKDNILYKFTQNKEPGAWDSTVVEKADVMGELNMIVYYILNTILGGLKFVKVDEVPAEQDENTIYFVTGVVTASDTTA